MRVESLTGTYFTNVIQEHVHLAWTSYITLTNRPLLAAHRKCQCRLAKLHCQDHVRNTDVFCVISLDSVLDPIIHHCSSLFGHVAKLSKDTSAHQALRCLIDLSLGHLPDVSWWRSPGCSQNRWLDQLCRDNGPPPADLRRPAVTHGHLGVLLWSSLTMC